MYLNLPDAQQGMVLINLGCAQAAKTEQLTLLNAERLLLAIESMDQRTLDRLFSAADTDHDGRIDLREFAYALAKINPDLPLAEAKDSATDFFVLFKVDPAR